jgi:hypothetical protein
MESIGFTCKCILLKIFTFLNFLYQKKEFRAKKNFRLSRGVAGVAGVVAVFGRNLGRS